MYIHIIIKNLHVVLHAYINFWSTVIICGNVFTIAMLDTSLVKKLKDGLDSEATPKDEVVSTVYMVYLVVVLIWWFGESCTVYGKTFKWENFCS